MIVQIVTKTRKIKLFRVTGGVRPYRGISRISHNIPQHLHLCLLPKNALLHNISSMTASCIQIEPHLPAT
jgi:hypothetical protein